MDRSSAVHEAGHAIVALLCGITVDRLALDTQDGGAETLTAEIQDPRTRALVALAGPAAQAAYNSHFATDDWIEHRRGLWEWDRQQAQEAV